jgi:CRP/FNR family transcriptional regulator, cyclic AMP receptor protein
MARLQTEAIGKSPVFAELSQRDLRRVARAAEVYTFNDGQDIVREGTRTDGLFVILEGSAKVIRGGRTIRRLRGGDFFGEIGLLDGGPRTATVVAVGPLRALVLLRKEFRQVVTDDPEVGYQILRGAARRLRSIESPLTTPVQLKGQ